VLYMVIMLYGVNVMRSVIEEKQSRIIEVLVSSLKPFELMLGKVIGVGSVGLFQVAIWAATAGLLITYSVQVAGLAGLPPEAAGSIQLPGVTVELLVLVLVYFFLGYLLYSSLFAVVGASVNQDSEAQQAQMPVIMLLMFSLFMSLGAMTSPDSQLARIGSLIPFSSPIIMPVRVATSDVGYGQILLSIGILAVGVIAVVYVSARIYRIGILMYGKRPNLKEILRWARQS